MKHPFHPELATDFGDRMVTLCDGRSGLRGGLRVEPRTPKPEPTAPGEPERPIIDFVASDETLDRYEEILSADGWRLEAYRQNPVFQNAHQYGDIVFTLGKALSTEVRDGRLCQRVEFATAVNPMARIAYGLYRGNFLNAVSVGFIPLRWETGSAEAGFRRRFLEQELLEVSAVGIPANPNALQLGLKTGAIRKADLQELLEVLQHLDRPATGTDASSPLSSRSTGASADYAGIPSAHWLALARRVRDVLRGA